MFLLRVWSHVFRDALFQSVSAHKSLSQLIQLPYINPVPSSLALLLPRLHKLCWLRNNCNRILPCNTKKIRTKSVPCAHSSDTHGMTARFFKEYSASNGSLFNIEQVLFNDSKERDVMQISVSRFTFWSSVSASDLYFVNCFPEPTSLHLSHQPRFV